MACHDFTVFGLPSKLPWPWRVWAVRRRLRTLAVDVVYFNDAHALTLGGLSARNLPGVATIAARRASFPIRSAQRYRRLCKRIFCVSECVRQRCVECGIPEAKLRVVHDGVDPRRVESGSRQRGREALALQEEEALLLSVGSLAECKGHRFLIDAMPAVRQQFPNARLAIAGAGNQQAQLTAQIARLGLQSHVHLLGFRHDVPDLIQACDLFVFPSIEEGLGSTLIDAMLAQRPIVATNAGGIPDVVAASTPGRSEVAWVVPAGDSPALNVAIREALSQPDAAALVAQRAQRRAWDHFTVDQMVDRSIGEFQIAVAEQRADKATRRRERPDP